MIALVPEYRYITEQAAGLIVEWGENTGTGSLVDTVDEVTLLPAPLNANLIIADSFGHDSSLN